MANDGGGGGGHKLSGRGKSQKLSPCSTGTRNSDWEFGKARSEGEEKIIYCTAAAMFMVQYSVTRFLHPKKREIEVKKRLHKRKKKVFCAKNP